MSTVDLNKTIHIEVTADIIWPWCYIGRRQLEAAIKLVEASFNVSWKPFLLDAHTAPEGVPLDIHLASKYGEKIAKQEMKGQGPMAKAGKSVGIKFDTERFIVNSVKSHLLSQYVLDTYGAEKQAEILDIMCKSYFEEAVNLNSDKVLMNLSQEAGIDKEKAFEYFTSQKNAKKLFTEFQKVKKRGIVGVPYYSIYIPGYNDNRPVAFSGSQSKSGFVDTLNKLLKEYHKSLKKQNGK